MAFVPRTVDQLVAGDRFKMRVDAPVYRCEQDPLRHGDWVAVVIVSMDSRDPRGRREIIHPADQEVLVSEQLST